MPDGTENGSIPLWKVRFCKGKKSPKSCIISKMKVLVFGGSFDPVHKGHVAMLKKAISVVKPDITHIVPAYQSPFKAKSPKPVKFGFLLPFDCIGVLFFLSTLPNSTLLIIHYFFLLTAYLL